MQYVLQERGLLALSLVNSSALSLPSMHECARIYFSVKGDVCCVSLQIMACMNSLSE